MYVLGTEGKDIATKIIIYREAIASYTVKCK